MPDDLEQRIRERAYRIWLDEGRPEGRAAAHWDMARELVSTEASQMQATEPDPATRRSRPDDQGEEQGSPKRRRRRPRRS